MRKRLLLLGGGHAEIPLILAARDLGYYVITTGNARDGLGHPYANENAFADFSDREAMLCLARELNVDAVCSGCNDFALLSTAYVCEKLGLPGHDSLDVSLQIHHKDKYRALAKRLGIPTPRAVTVYSEEDFKNIFEDEGSQKIDFPVIVKPVDLTGGKGVCRADNYGEAVCALRDAFARTRENHVVVEEFVEGSNHGFSAFLENQKVVFCFCDNEQYFINKYMVSGANTPSSSGTKCQMALVDYCERIARELNLVDGILHIQYIERANGEPVIIEICRRPPGDLYIKFVKYAAGVDYPKMLILAETGEWGCSQILLPPLGCSPKPFLRHCIMASTEGRVRDVVFAPDLQQNIVEKFLWFSPGDVVDDILHYKAGIVFLQFSSVGEMLEKTSRMTELIQIEME